MFQVLSSCPKHNCNCGRPFPLAKRKNNFSGPEKLFFIFTFQAPLRAASELFRCFSSCPKRNCNCGRPFPLAKRKNNFSGPEKLFFIFTFQAPLRAASELFRCFSSCPKRNCNCGRPFQLAKEKTTFQALKSCFLFSPSRHPCEQPVSFSGAFPAAQSVIAIAGDPSNWPKRNYNCGRCHHRNEARRKRKQCFCWGRGG